MREQLEQLRQKQLDYLALLDLIIGQLPPETEQPPIEGALLVSTHEIVNPDTFLEEVNEPITLASDIPENKPEIPSDKDLTEILDKSKEVEKLKETFSLVPEGFTLVERHEPSFTKMACYLIEKDATAEWFLANREAQKICYSSKDKDYLLNILVLKDEFLKGADGEMDFNLLLAQSDFSEIEIMEWEKLKIKHNLK